MAEAKKILLGLTTTPKSDWRDKVKEIENLGIKEIALFPTFLSIEERKELYRLLDASPIENIPYVHLRDDFTEAEMDFLITRFKSKTFSCHADPAGFGLLDVLAKYASLIYVENHYKLNKGTDNFFTADSFNRRQVIGICLDLAHYEVTKQRDKATWRQLQDMLKAFPVGVNHISAVSGGKVMGLFNTAVDKHYLDNLTELEYLKVMPNEYFAKYIAIELENSFAEQIEIKKYLELILKNKLL